MSPQVSYIMAAFNHEAHVGSMVESVIAQTHQDWELIAIDDGSTDRTAEVIRNYAVQDSRIRLEVQSNAGIVATRNRGATLTTGAYLSFIDSDDLLLPNRTQQLLSRFLANPRCVLAYGDAWIEDEEGARISFWSKHPVVSGPGPSPLLKGGCFIPALSVLVATRSIFRFRAFMGRGREYGLP